MEKNEKTDFLSRIAYMYYKHNMDLKEIGKYFNTSYSTISRGLKKARDIGLITININHPISRLLDLEESFRSKFELKDVRIVNISEVTSEEDAKNLVAKEGATYLKNSIKNNIILGISWGSTMYQLINSFSTMSNSITEQNYNVDLVQINGNYPTVPLELNSQDLVRRLKNLFSGKYYFINSEAFVDNKKIRDLFLNSSSIKKTFKMHKRIDVALLGIGAFDDNNINKLYKEYLKPKEISEIKKKNAVGENTLIFYDIHGKTVNTDLANRTIGISVENLLNIKNKIVIASGASKAKAIVGALNAGMVDTLISDSKTIKNIINNFI